MKSNLETAVLLCRRLEPIAIECGGHVALTGGCLYKDGVRKDVDIIVYRIRQVDRFNWENFFFRIRMLGIQQGRDYGWCKKATGPFGENIDFFDPENSGEYPTDRVGDSY